MPFRWRASTYWWVQLLKVFEHRCAYCAETPKGGSWTVDHFIPLKLGGTWRLENLVPCCRRCNSAKGEQDPYRWMPAAGVDVQKFRELRDRWCTMIYTHFVFRKGT